MKSCGQISANLSVAGRLVALLFVIVLSSATAHAQTHAYQFTRLIGGDGHDRAHAVAADDAGNTYITGIFERTVDFDLGPGTATLTSIDSPTTPGGYDCFVASYDVNGNYRWAFAIGSVGSDGATDIAVDPSGNVVVSGHFASSADFDPGPNNVILNGGGHFIAKYTPTGQYLFAFRLGAYIRAIALDGSGNIGVTGDYLNTVDFNPGPKTNNLSNSGRFVAVYSPTGAYVWALRINTGVVINQSNQIAFSMMYGIDFDNTGNVVVSGYYTGKVCPNPSQQNSCLTTPVAATFVAKYTSRGKYSFASQIPTTYMTGGSIELDGSNNIIITGNLDGTHDFDPGAGTQNLTTAGSSDIFVAKYTPTMGFLWAFRVGTIDEDESHSLAIDASNNIYITGRIITTTDFDPGEGVSEVTGGGESRAYYIASYSSTGGFLWAAGAGHGTTINGLIHTGSHIDVDGSGRVHMARWCNGTGDFDPGDAVETLTTFPHVNGGSSGDAFYVRYDPVILPKMKAPDVRPTDRQVQVVPALK